jgi:hypothetical protein
LLPKSGCSNDAPEPSISRMYAAERDETGNFETSSFHALSAGNVGQPPTVGAAAGGAAGGALRAQVDATVVSARATARCAVTRENT